MDQNGLDVSVEEEEDVNPMVRHGTSRAIFAPPTMNEVPSSSNAHPSEENSGNSQENRSVSLEYGLLPAEEQEAWLPFLEQQCKSLTTHDTSRLDKMLAEVSRDVSVQNSTLYCSMPVLALLRTTLFRSAMFMISIFYLALSAYNVSLVHGEHQHIQTIRFTVVENRDATRPLSIASLSDLTLTHLSCPLSPLSSTLTNTSLSLSFPTAVSVTGWRFTSAGDDRGMDVKRLLVEASHDADVQLHVIGQKGSDFGFVATEFQEWELPLPSRAEQTLTLRFIRPVALVIGEVLVSAIIGFHGLLAVWLVHVNRIMSARGVLSVSVLCLLFTSFAVLIALLAQHHWLHAAGWSSKLVAALVLCPALLPAGGERFLPSSLAFLFLLSASIIIAHAIVSGVPSYLVLSHELYLCCVAGAVSVLLLDKRTKMLSWVQSGVRQDKERFDAAWASVLSAASPSAASAPPDEESGRLRSSTSADELQELLECVRDCSFGHSQKRPVQTVRDPALATSRAAVHHARVIKALFPSASASLHRAHTLRAASSGSHSQTHQQQHAASAVQSLDQLYAQAQSCQRIMRDTAKGLMLECGGMLAVAPEGEEGPRSSPDWARRAMSAQTDPAPAPSPTAKHFMRWDVVTQDAELIARSHWTDLKPAKRAVEKVVQHCHGEVSRLTDVCREMLVFERLSGITECLRAMERDSKLVLESVRSNLAPHYDASYSAGFRAVVVKFRIVTPLTKTFGVDGHVCEFLLVPLAIANCMSAASHAQYLHLRELRDLQKKDNLLLAAWAQCTLCRPRKAGDVTQPSSLTAPRRLDNLIASLQFKTPSVARSNGRASHRSHTNRNNNLRTASAPVDMSHAAMMMRRARSDPHLRDSVAEDQSMGAGMSMRRALRRCSTFQIAAPAPLSNASNASPELPSPAASLAAARAIGGADVAQRAESSGHGRGSVTSTARSLTRTTSHFSRTSHASNLWGRVGSALTFGRLDSGRPLSDGDTYNYEEEQAKLSRVGALLSLYRRRTTEMPGRLDSEVKEISVAVAVAHADQLSVFATSFPIAAAMCKPWFLLPVLLIAAGHLLSAATGLSTLASSGRLSASAVRLVPHSPNERTNSSDQHDAQAFWDQGLWRFGVLRGGCPRPLTPDPSDPFLFSLGDTPLEMHGVFVSSVDYSPLPPLAFTVQVQPQPGQPWTTRGAMRYSSSCFLSWSDAPLTAAAGAAEVQVNFTPPWFVWVGKPGSALLLALAWFAVALCALAGWVRGGRPLVLGGLAGAALLWIASAAGRHAAGEGHEGVEAVEWAQPLVLGATATALLLREQLLLEAMLLLAAVNMLLVLLAPPCSPPRAPVALHSAEWLVLLLVCAALLVVRAISKYLSNRAIEQDMKTYDTAWEALLAEKEAAIDEIQEVASGIETTLYECPQPLVQTFTVSDEQRTSRSRFGRTLSPRSRRSHGARSPRRSPSPRGRRSPSPTRHASVCSERGDTKLTSEFGMPVTPQSLTGRLEKLSERLKNASFRTSSSAAAPWSRRTSRESVGSAPGTGGAHWWSRGGNGSSRDLGAFCRAETDGGPYLNPSAPASRYGSPTNDVNQRGLMPRVGSAALNASSRSLLSSGASPPPRARLSVERHSSELALSIRAMLQARNVEMQTLSPPSTSGLAPGLSYDAESPSDSPHFFRPQTPEHGARLPDEAAMEEAQLQPAGSEEALVPCNVGGAGTLWATDGAQGHGVWARKPMSSLRKTPLKLMSDFEINLQDAAAGARGAGHADGGGEEGGGDGGEGGGEDEIVREDKEEEEKDSEEEEKGKEVEGAKAEKKEEEEELKEVKEEEGEEEKKEEEGEGEKKEEEEGEEEKKEEEEGEEEKTEEEGQEEEAGGLRLPLTLCPLTAASSLPHPRTDMGHYHSLPHPRTDMGHYHCESPKGILPAMTRLQPSSSLPAPAAQAILMSRFLSLGARSRVSAPSSSPALSPTANCTANNANEPPSPTSPRASLTASIGGSAAAHLRSWRNQRATSDGAYLTSHRRRSIQRFGSAAETSSSSSFVMRVGTMLAIPSSPLTAFLSSRRNDENAAVRVVESLDQLYGQAAMLYPILKTKVQQWAQSSMGMFPVGLKKDKNAPPQYQLWSEVEEADVSKVRWAHLKGPQRAIEKLSRSYQGRISHLLDVCRQSIVFEEPSHLAECLSTIAADPEVTIVKVVNRFHRDYNSRKSLGYRDVNLNLRIDTDETRRLGVELHICEVQMLLRTFAELKSNEGHKRYVAFRNARGQ